MRERGYNQSQLLAKTIADVTHRELIEKAVIRAKATKSQTTLAHAERVTNLRNAFSVVEEDSLRGKTVTVVDDVFTSGTTLNEMGKTLLEAGAEHVFGLVLARALST
jgi:ComF family protein